MNIFKKLIYNLVIKNNRRTILATNKSHLEEIIDKEISKYGNECDLNHIDVSEIVDMSGIFAKSDFNGDISQWNTSKVINMRLMFSKSIFNGDISGWNVENVMNMESMFYNASFNSDVSAWDTSNVKVMRYMFYNSKFSGDISKWNVSNVEYIESICVNCPATLPYWAKIPHFSKRQLAVIEFHCNKEKEEIKKVISNECNNKVINKVVKI